MIHLFELALYFGLSAYLVAKILERPVWGVGYYLLNFFAQPQYWQWGNPLPYGMRWSLLAAYLMLAGVWLNGQETDFREDRGIRRTSVLAVLIAINGLIVHFIFADNLPISWPLYVEMAKFVVLYFIIKKAIQSKRDFLLLNWFFIAGIFYWGFEARVLGTLTMQQGRLEDFGGPGCSKSNELANIIVSLLPVFIGFLAFVRWKQKLMVVASILLGLNVMLLTQSRGGFIGLIAAGIIIPLVASGKARKRAIQGVGLGVLAFILLAGNPEIMARFMSTFSDEEATTHQAKVDKQSKESRRFFWMVGLDIVSDYPFGSGGDTFASKKALDYMKKKGALYYNNSVHQGYINEALDWGVQGLLFHLGFLASGMWCAFRTMRFRKKIGDITTAFYGPCLLGGYVAFLAGCLVGDFLYLEWGYWLTILAVCYTKLFGQANYGVLADTKVTAEQKKEGDQDLVRELALGNT